MNLSNGLCIHIRYEHKEDTLLCVVSNTCLPLQKKSYAVGLLTFRKTKMYSSLTNSKGEIFIDYGTYGILAALLKILEDGFLLAILQIC